MVNTHWHVQMLQQSWCHSVSATSITVSDSLGGSTWIMTSLVANMMSMQDKRALELTKHLLSITKAPRLGNVATGIPPHSAAISSGSLRELQQLSIVLTNQRSRQVMLQRQFTGKALNAVGMHRTLHITNLSLYDTAVHCCCTATVLAGHAYKIQLVSTMKTVKSNATHADTEDELDWSEVSWCWSCTYISPAEGDARQSPALICNGSGIHMPHCETGLV